MFLFNMIYSQDMPHDSMPFECNTCHSLQSWTDIRFDHSQTDFALQGKHLSVKCTECHKLNNFADVGTSCFSCHTDVHQAKLGLACSECHSPNGWSDLNIIAIHSNTTFPLTGAHFNLDCKACHISEIENEFSFLDTGCYNCHQADFKNNLNAIHTGLPAMPDCQQCHTTSAWQPASFDHSQTQFPLTGAHRMLPCSACHSTGFIGTPTDCFSCHQQDYDNTTNPNHQAASFPTTCENCHSPVIWNQTTWDHDAQYFPIYSGRHQGRWNTCADCHVNPNNYRVFECIFCHEHNQQDMDNKHHEVPGYAYVSSACLSCHPRGQGD